MSLLRKQESRCLDSRVRGNDILVGRSIERPYVCTLGGRMVELGSKRALMWKPLIKISLTLLTPS
jgi:hypothetical protein